MAQLPSHPDTDQPGPAEREPAISEASPRRRALVIAAAVALVVLFVVLHLTGVVGAGSH